jgi:hypothetical protein
LNEHAARKHSGSYALELLADEKSRALPRSAVSALFRIGWRDTAEANAAEWALLHLTELALTLREQPANLSAPVRRPHVDPAGNA